MFSSVNQIRENHVNPIWFFWQLSSMPSVRDALGFESFQCCVSFSRNCCFNWTIEPCRNRFKLHWINSCVSQPSWKNRLLNVKSTRHCRTSYGNACTRNRIFDNSFRWKSVWIDRWSVSDAKQFSLKFWWQGREAATFRLFFRWTAHYALELYFSFFFKWQIYFIWLLLALSRWSLLRVILWVSLRTSEHCGHGLRRFCAPAFRNFESKKLPAQDFPERVIDFGRKQLGKCLKDEIMKFRVSCQKGTLHSQVHANKGPWVERIIKKLSWKRKINIMKISFNLSPSNV